MIKFLETFKINKSDINTGEVAKHVHDIKKVLWEKEKKRQAQLFAFAHGLNSPDQWYVCNRKEFRKYLSKYLCQYISSLK